MVLAAAHRCKTFGGKLQFLFLRAIQEKSGISRGDRILAGIDCSCRDLALALGVAWVREGRAHRNARRSRIRWELRGTYKLHGARLKRTKDSM